MRKSSHSLPRPTSRPASRISSRIPSRLPFRLAILLFVAIVGLATTAWVAQTIAGNAEERLQQGFELAAREQGEAVVRAFVAPLDEFFLLQRFFGTVGRLGEAGPQGGVDWPIFRDFAEPMLAHTGMRSIGWAPAIDTAQRAAFEVAGKTLWNEQFTIREVDPKGALVPTAEHARYFPVLYSVATRFSPMLLGVDLYHDAAARAVIGRSIADNTMASLDLPPSPALTRPDNEHFMLFLLPVYHAALTPSATADDRLQALSGMLFMAVDSADLLNSASISSARAGLQMSLFDPTLASPLLHRLGAANRGEVDKANGALPTYSRSFQLAGRPLMLEIAANADWIKARKTSSTLSVALAGTLLTFLLLIIIDRLLARGARAESAVESAVDSAVDSLATAFAHKQQAGKEQHLAELRAAMTRLEESEERFRGAVSVLIEGLIIVSADEHFVFANPAAEAFFGYRDGGLAGRTPAELLVDRLQADGQPLAPADYPSTIALRDGREVRAAVMGYRFASAAVRWVEINAAPLHDGAGAISGAVVTFSDITARRRAEEQLRLASEAIHCSGEGILITDAAHRILSLNPAFETMSGYRAPEVIGSEIGRVALTRDDASAERGETAEPIYVPAHLQAALASSGYWQGEVWNQRKNGETYPGWLGVSAVYEEGGQDKALNYVYIFSDMSERKSAQALIEFLAHHDALTGLPNRLLLRDRVEQAQALATRAGQRVALMFLDLDRFKTINDSLGHPVGDALLKEIVERLKTCVRESDTISRQGGDEFIILLNDVRDSEAAARVADKIAQRMADPFVLAGHALNTSFSIGIALYPDDGEDFDSLLQKADTAMYHAKEAGRNAHRFFRDEMNRQAVEHLTLETQLRTALERNEFVLHYQPQLDLRDGSIVGVEALIRWNSPENGLVSPVRFIPVAEVSGLIVPIGAWVIEEACRQARAWQLAGLPAFTVAVNLSAVQFRRLDLINTVINALVLSDLDAQCLELELTESILLQDAEGTLDVVRRLKALGVKLSVDDFGTGYSSLAYLKRFAVDKLKIDQSFIRDLESDPDDAAIVRAIIQMAHSLKLKTIAEGVENDALTSLLRLFNCDEIQGFGFARPLPAAELEAFVRAHQSALVPAAPSEGMKRLNS